MSVFVLFVVHFIHNHTTEQKIIEKRFSHKQISNILAYMLDAIFSNCKLTKLQSSGWTELARFTLFPTSIL